MHTGYYDDCAAQGKPILNAPAYPRRRRDIAEAVSQSTVRSNGQRV